MDSIYGFTNSLYQQIIIISDQLSSSVGVADYKD